MKKLIGLILLCMVFFAISASAQKSSATVKPRPPKAITFDKLSDYVDDFHHRRAGERYIVSGVPMPSSIKYVPLYKMYSFQADPDGGVTTSFFTSLAAKKVFQPYLSSSTASLRITCTLLEFAGEFDVYRTSFATRIEGIDDNGEVLWTAEGAPPAKVKFRQ